MEKLAQLRAAMNQAGLDAYIIYNSDAHQSEYIADYWKSIAYLTGFTGSNASIAVTDKAAILWTDGRYFTQAESELAGSGFKLYKMAEPGVPTLNEYLAEALPATAVIGFDGRAVAMANFNALVSSLPQGNFKSDHDIMADIWSDRPSLPKNPVWIHGLEYAGLSAAEKIAQVRAQMEKQGADAYVVAALDDIMWLANIRGSDIENSTVSFAYALITKSKAFLFIDDEKLSEAAKSFLTDFEIRPYESIFSMELDYKKILYNDGSTSVRLYNSLKGNAEKVNVSSIIGDLKAVKNATEIKNIENSQINEGVALVRLFKWLSELDLNETKLTEGQVEQKLKDLRIQADCGYLDESFNPICGYNANGAIIHYRSLEGGATILPEGFLLIDTGAHYLDGTTDTTRTIPVGPLTEQMKADYTLVLKANLALSRAIFATGTIGMQLDILARQHLWQNLRDYKHGTGHGVGFTLGVHEGPQSISTAFKNVAIKPGMLSSNEPGLYRPGQYGIRIETLILAKELQSNEFGTFLGFDVVSYAPINTDAIKIELMTETEIQQLNAYHEEVYNKLSPRLTEAERNWLRHATKVI